MRADFELFYTARAYSKSSHSMHADSVYGHCITALAFSIFSVARHTYAIAPRRPLPLETPLSKTKLTARSAYQIQEPRRMQM